MLNFELPDGTVRTYLVPCAISSDGQFALWRAPKQLELDLCQQNQQRPNMQGRYDMEQLQAVSEDSSSMFFSSLIPPDTRKLVCNLRLLQTNGIRLYQRSQNLRSVGALRSS